MLLRFSLLLAVVGCVRTRNDFSRNGIQVRDSEFNRFALWPSVHNGAVLLRIRRENTAAEIQGPSEGSAGAKSPVPTEQAVTTPATSSKNTSETGEHPSETPSALISKNEISIGTKTLGPKGYTPTPFPLSLHKNRIVKSATTPESLPTRTSTINEGISGKVLEPVLAPVAAIHLKDNGTTANMATQQWDMSKPDVVTRGLIVFGGFAVLGLAYFMFYRTKKSYKDTNNSNNNDANQFRYGVLQSEDRRDNMELSRVPLTMESDDEEDEDLEIFDLEQRKKSMSYVNLQVNDEDIVLSPRDSNEGDGVLLDIEDGSDTLISWSNNGSKSIL